MEKTREIDAKISIAGRVPPSSWLSISRAVIDRAIRWSTRSIQSDRIIAVTEKSTRGKQSRYLFKALWTATVCTLVPFSLSLSTSIISDDPPWQRGRRGEDGSCPPLDGLLPWTSRRTPRERNSPCATRVPRCVSVATIPASVLAEALSPSWNFTGAAIASPARWVTLFTIRTWIRSRHGVRYLSALPASRLFIAGVGEEVGRTRARTRWPSSPINFQWMLVKRFTGCRYAHTKVSAARSLILRRFQREDAGGKVARDTWKSARFLVESDRNLRNGEEPVGVSEALCEQNRSCPIPTTDWRSFLLELL